MTVLVFQLLGGIGLFLLGMVLLTDGIKSYAGDALKAGLMRFTGTPLKAFGSGALVTAMVQSSSATTVTVIGFVSAGLLTFPQAIGVVFGASLGTTGTSWIVSVLGLKVSLGFYALPLVGVGAFIRLLGRGRWRPLGLALGGFGLIFIGIETLQTAMSGLSGVFDLASLPSEGFLAHLLAMLIGILLTVIMQSSSAAVATALTALHAGAINFEQAASVVIGAAIGTTVTGALAAIGGTTPAKRTACAHILFNLATGLIAVLLLPLFLSGILWAQDNLGLERGAISLAAFHTAFIGLGVLLFLPFVDQFARWIERILPDRSEPTLLHHLDKSLLHTPPVALEASRRAMTEVAAEIFLLASEAIRQKPETAAYERKEQAALKLAAIQEFFEKIPSGSDEQPISESRVAQVHAIDHLTRMHSHLFPPSGNRELLQHPRIRDAAARACHLLDLAAQGFSGEVEGEWWHQVQEEASNLTEVRRFERPALLNETSVGGWHTAKALELLDVIRWLDRLGYHTWRISNYLAGPGMPEQVP